jgi:predicted metalloprotease with PDZ domain
VTAALNQVLPYDWSAFWTKRLESTAAHAPLEGLLASGWRLTYSESLPEALRARENTNRTTEERYSIGIVLGEDGMMVDVIPGSPADKAGVGPGMRLVAVNGRRWTRETLREAISDSKAHSIELLVANGEFYRTHRLDYSGGLRYPRLERDSKAPDLLTAIFTARAKP